MCKAEKKLRCNNRLGEVLDPKGYSQSNGNILSRRERTIRSIFIALGVVMLGYIYAESLWAQQAVQKRISIIQATDFPRDI